jgi:acylphosphatase
VSGPADPARRFLVDGRVQGVGFRYWTLRAARQLGLSGRVRNLPDGKVEVEASGGPESLAAFRALLRQGPTGARVDSLSEEELATAAGWDGFEIDRI